MISCLDWSLDSCYNIILYKGDLGNMKPSKLFQFFLILSAGALLRLYGAGSRDILISCHRHSTVREFEGVLVSLYE